MASPEGPWHVGCRGLEARTRCLGHHWGNVSERRTRLWETPRIDVGWGGADRFGVPAIEPVRAPGVDIDADPAGFTVVNTSASDLSVLITLMARARGTDAATSRGRLLTVTSPESRADVLRVADADDASAYRRLWLDDIEVHDHARGGSTAVRSGSVVVPLPAGATFRLGHDPEELREGVVVAAVAAVGDGLEGALLPVDRGAAASIGDRPEPPA